VVEYSSIKRNLGSQNGAETARRKTDKTSAAMKSSQRRFAKLFYKIHKAVCKDPFMNHVDGMKTAFHAATRECSFWGYPPWVTEFRSPGRRA
jgi:hypothetical protein